MDRSLSTKAAHGGTNWIVMILLQASELSQDTVFNLSFVVWITRGTLRQLCSLSLVLTQSLGPRAIFNVRYSMWAWRKFENILFIFC